MAISVNIKHSNIDGNKMELCKIGRSPAAVGCFLIHRLFSYVRLFSHWRKNDINHAGDPMCFQS